MWLVGIGFFYFTGVVVDKKKLSHYYNCVGKGGYYDL